MARYTAILLCLCLGAACGGTGGDVGGDDPVPASCGDGVLDAGEGCDDGDQLSGDGCSSACRVEFCGDGVVQPGLGEDCDDGNATSGDGCSSSCSEESSSDASDYFASAVGDRLSYEVFSAALGSVSSQYSSTVASIERFAGVDAYRLRVDSQAGSTSSSSDSYVSVADLHSLGARTPQACGTVQATNDPPARFLPGGVDVGDDFEADYEIALSGPSACLPVGVLPVRVRSTGRVDRFETVVTAAGTFDDAMVLEIEETQTSQVVGQPPFDASLLLTRWVVKGLGLVRTEVWLRTASQCSAAGLGPAPCLSSVTQLTDYDVEGPVG